MGQKKIWEQGGKHFWGKDGKMFGGERRKIAVWFKFLLGSGDIAVGGVGGNFLMWGGAKNYGVW